MCPVQMLPISPVCTGVDPFGIPGKDTAPSRISPRRCYLCLRPSLSLPLGQRHHARPRRDHNEAVHLGLRNYLKILTHKLIERFLGRFVWFLQRHREEPHGEIRDVRNHMGSTGRALGTRRAYHPGGRPTPKPGAASELILDRCSTASSSACAAGANGTELPKELGDDSTIHRTFQRWVERGVLHRMWGALVEGCEELDGVDWEWQAADGGSFWGGLIGPNPTDRGKAGSKRSLLVDGEGGPSSITVAGANVHDAKLLEATLDAIVVKRPQPTEEEPQHLCLDKGYDNPSGRRAAARHDYQAHVQRIGEEKLDASGPKRYPARRLGSGIAAAYPIEPPGGNGGGKSLHIQLQMYSIATPFLGTNLPPSILDIGCGCSPWWLVVTVVRDSQ